MNGAKDLGAGADVDAVADDRRAALVGVAQTHGDAVADTAIVAENSISADDDAAEVVNHEAAAKCYFTWKLNSGQYFGQDFQQLIEE